METDVRRQKLRKKNIPYELISPLSEPSFRSSVVNLLFGIRGGSLDSK